MSKFFNSKKRRGFTLIETLIYTAIISIIISSFILILYNIVQSVDRTTRNVDLVEQKQFLIQKIDWVLQSVSVVNTPTAGDSAASISVNKINYALNPVVVSAQNGVLRISEGGGADISLTPTGVVVSNLNFIHTATANETSIKFTATISNSATSTNISYTKIIK